MHFQVDPSRTELRNDLPVRDPQNQPKEETTRRIGTPEVRKALSDVPPLGVDEIQVWAWPCAVWVPRLSSLWCVLSEEERERAARFRTSEDRHHFVIGRGGARHLAGHFLGMKPGAIEFALDPTGKPFIRNDALEVNVSHSGDWVLAGFTANRDIGIDVEQRRADFDVLEVASAVFSPWERETLAEFAPTVRQRLFFDVWTRKEAVIKADGAGVSFGFPRFDVEFRPGCPPAVRRLAGGDPTQWTMWALDGFRGHAGALASRSSVSDVTLGILQGL